MQALYNLIRAIILAFEPQADDEFNILDKIFGFLFKE